MTLAKTDQDLSLLESVVVDGDLANLSSADRLSYYAKVCDSMGLNPLTKPFEYIRLNGKLILYAGKNCTDQLCNNRGINIDLEEGKIMEGVYMIHAHATLGGRSTTSTGAVPIGGIKGEALANAMMKAETKAKRRAVLSLVGLSMLDGTEVETIPDREAVVVDQATGEIMAPPERPKPLPTPERKPITLYSLLHPAVIKLAERLDSEGMSWQRFVGDVLKTNWEQYVEEFGTPGTAYEAYLTWKANQGEERHDALARVLDTEQVTMDGLTAKEDQNAS